MRLLHSTTFTWWQIGIVKLCLLALGIAVGAQWHTFFIQYLTTLIVITVVTAVYLLSIWWKQ